MSLTTILLALVIKLKLWLWLLALPPIAGLWLFNKYVPLSPGTKRAINIISIVFVCVWLIIACGISIDGLVR